MNSKIKKINNAIKEKDVVIVAYLMEGCGWCDKLKPVWSKVKKSKSHLFDITVSRKNPTILEGLDCDTSDTNGGFPCICVYKNGKKSKCKSGYQDLNQLTDFVNTNSKQSGGFKYKRTSKTKKKKTIHNKTKRRKKRGRKSKARSAFYKKIKKKFNKKKKKKK